MRAMFLSCVVVLSGGWLLSSGLSSPVWAQTETKPSDAPDAPSARPAPGALLDRSRAALNDLKLSDDQTTKIDAIYAKAKEDLAALREQLKDAEPRERMEKMSPVIRQLREDVSNVLTDEQKEAFQKKMAAMGGAGGGMMQRLKDALGKLELSDEQKTKIEEIAADARSKAEKIRADAQGDTAAVREKLTAMMQDTRQKLEAVLTPEQRQKLRESMPPRRGGPATRPVEPPTESK